MLIGFVSAKSSPGVTTTALAVAAQWPRQALVLEADPFGGDMRAGLGGGPWPANAGIADLVVDLRSAGIDEALRRRVHRPAPHSPPVLAGLGCVGQAGSVPWDRVGGALARLRGADTIADCGRFAMADGVLPLLQICDVIVLVTGSSLRAARSASRAVTALRDGLGVDADDARARVLVVRPGEPYTASEMSTGCGARLLGELPCDARSAAVWSDGEPPGRAFERSPLQRAARRVAEDLCRLETPADGAA